MRYGIVVTTIHDGAFIHEYYNHFSVHGGMDSVRFYIVGDVNTPPVCAEQVAQYSVRGLPWYYISPADQMDFLKPFPELAAEIPWRSDNRRNVGFLMAYRDGCDVVIAIDDDNYPVAGSDFLAGHALVGSTVERPLAVGHAGWFNVCSLLDIACPAFGDGGGIFPRGFPYARRDPRSRTLSENTETGRVAINVGLWTGDPDVDAATRLVTRCSSREGDGTSRLLDTAALTPINTQNTALIREAIPAYYYVKMGLPIAGMTLDRYGDIFSGFFVQMAVRATGGRVAVGGPYVEHRRTPHDLYKDLWHELAGMKLLDDFLPLIEMPLTPTASFGDAALEIADRLVPWAEAQTGFLWCDDLRDYFRTMSRNLQLWVGVCRQLA